MIIILSKVSIYYLGIIYSGFKFPYHQSSGSASTTPGTDSHHSFSIRGRLYLLLYRTRIFLLIKRYHHLFDVNVFTYYRFANLYTVYVKSVKCVIFNSLINL